MCVRRHRLTTATIWALTAAIAAPLAASGITPVSQSRKVATSAFVNGVKGSGSDSDSATAPNFAPFISSISSTASPPSQGFLSVTAAASQTSIITPFCVAASGSASFNATNCFSGCFASDADGSSLCTIVFDVATPISFSLNSSLSTISTPEFPWSSATFKFSGPGGSYAQATVTDAASPASPTLVGLLIPGQYTLTISADAGEQFNIPDLSAAQYSMMFTVTSCVGDFDDSGTVDGADVGVLLGAWGTTGGADGAADLDCDGTVNGGDVGVLLSSWGSCPALVSTCCGSTAAPGCDTPSCQLCVCAIDPFCCDVQWDFICASEAADQCQSLCLCGV